jgi:uncharacterized protein (TIGR02118 family)
MLRFMTLYNKRPGMDYDTFRHEVMDVHVPMVVKLPGLKRYQQSLNVNWPPTMDGLQYDGIAELWFETAEAQQNAMAQAQEPLAHAAEILDMDTLTTMVVEEHPIPLQGAPDTDTDQLVRYMFFYNKRADLTYDEFKRHVMEIHVPMVTKLPGLKRYQQSFNINWPPTSDGLPYDGIAELWFESQADFEAAMSSPEAAIAVEDRPKVLDESTLTMMVVKEHPIALPTV